MLVHAAATLAAAVVVVVVIFFFFSGFDVLLFSLLRNMVVNEYCAVKSRI